MKFNSAVAPENGWEVLSSETHYENAHLSVRTEEVRPPASRTGRRWTVVHRQPAVIIAAMTRDGALVLIRQERIPIRAAIWEVPAGQVDDPNETEVTALEAVALRELQEESGYQLSDGGEVISLGDFFASPGFTDEQGHFFLVRTVELSADGPAHTESESILDCRAFLPAEIVQMIARGEIRDANTLSICARLAVRGFLSLQA